MSQPLVASASPTSEPIELFMSDLRPGPVEMLASRLPSIMRQSGAPKLGANLGAKLEPMVNDDK